MRLRLRIDGGFSGAEWLVDNVGVNMCESQGLPAAPYAGSGELVGTTGTVTWIAGTPDTGYQLNLTYDPPVPGAPTSVPATGSPGSANTYTVTLPNLNPDGTYRVLDRAGETVNRNLVGTTDGHRLGGAVAELPDGATALPADMDAPQTGGEHGLCRSGGTSATVVTGARNEKSIHLNGPLASTVRAVGSGIEA